MTIAVYCTHYDIVVLR